VLDLGGGAKLTVLTAGPRGAVLLLEYEEFRALFPIGSDFDALDELEMGEVVGEVNLLLLADAGYTQLNPQEWIDFLDPQLVVLSVAADDLRGMPPLATLEALGERALLRTDANGWIEVMSDGNQMWINVQRGGPATPIPTITPTPTETPFPDEIFPTEPPLFETPIFPFFETPTP
ncbi:MAG: hypothetical protein AB1750_18065, partial [Chloroflexota bacterium]